MSSSSPQRLLILEKKNDVHLIVVADEDVRRELGEFFTFSVPGFKFMPQYRNRIWDGKIRLFSYANRQIYTGLYPYILNWCEENNIVVDVTGAGDIVLSCLVYLFEKYDIKNRARQTFSKEIVPPKSMQEKIVLPQNPPRPPGQHKKCPPLRYKLPIDCCPSTFPCFAERMYHLTVF